MAFLDFRILEAALLSVARGRRRLGGPSSDGDPENHREDEIGMQRSAEGAAQWGAQVPGPFLSR